MSPKRWTDEEIISIIISEMQDTTNDTIFRKNRPPTTRELAEMILVALDQRHLIERAT